MSAHAPPSAPGWQPCATPATLAARARLLARIRVYFAQHGVLEVETPALSRCGSTDPNLDSFATRYCGPGAPATDLYLHTSPEFAMKRLLAAGSGSIYQICKVFRNGEYGSRHNPEFSLLEWYRVGWDYRQLMHEVAALIDAAFGELRRLHAPEYISYRAAFQRYAQIDGLSTDIAPYASAAQRLGIACTALMDIDAWRDLLLTHVIEPQLGRERLTVLYDYPASQAALARVRHDDVAIAERFEVYLDGIELANGFSELTDAHEQQTRFANDCARRVALGKSAPPPDLHLIAALAAGLPPCAGVALGIDRLVGVALGKTALREVLAFPFERA